MVLPMALNHSLNGLEKCYVLGGSFVLAAAMYFIVEQPIRSRALLSRRPTLSLSMGGVFVACVGDGCARGGYRRTVSGRQQRRHCAGGGRHAHSDRDRG